MGDKREGFVDEGGKSLKLFRIGIAEPLTHQVQCPYLFQSFKGKKVSRPLFRPCPP
jgi:hypothetical protein